MAQPETRSPRSDARLERNRLTTIPAVPPEQSWAQTALPNEPLVRLSWSRYLAALRRNKWLIVVVVLLGTAVGAFLSRRVTPDYEVHSTLWTSNTTPDNERAEPIRAGEQMRQTSWPDLATSFAILESVVRKMSLHVRATKPGDSTVLADFETDERFRPGTYELRVDDSGWQYRLLAADGAQLQAGIIGDSIGRSLGFRWKPSPAAFGPNREVEFTLVSPRDAALGLKRSLKVTFSRESNLLGLSMTGSDPERITAIMKTLLDEFIGTAAELKKRNVTEVSKALKEQLDHAERELKDSEVALENFRVRTITLPSEVAPAAGADAPRNPIFDTFFARQIEYDNIRRQRLALERTLSAVQQGQLGAGSLWAVATVDSTAPPDLQAALTELSEKQGALKAARRTFTDGHSVVQELNEEIQTLATQTIPLLVTGLIEDLRRREGDLASQVQGTARELRDIPNRTTEEMRLRRNVEARGALFARLSNRYEEVTLAEASTVPDVSILDSPVAPQHPSHSRAPYVIMFAALVSIAVGIGLALLRDRLDTRFRYAEQATNELGLDVIGAVPALKVTDQRRDPDEESQLVEAFRGIRLSLTHAFKENGRVLLTVSSPGPGDGKSVICSHLALSFAEAGYRTILVDGDLRRGELHSRFSLERRPGLIDYLDKELALEDVLRASGYTNLTVIPRGALHQRAPELLMSPRMSNLIGELEPRYDAIIVDSPPLGAGIDPFVLGTATGNLLLVLRSGETDRKIAEAKLKLVARLPIRLLGVVLNDVQDEGSYPYYAYAPSDISDESARSRDPESPVAEFARRTVSAPAEKR